jgi:hypothetical protein
MKSPHNALLLAASLLSAVAGTMRADDTTAEVKEKQFAGPGGLAITVRMQGPYDADVPLQIACYFKHRAEGDKTSGAPVELDKRLGGAIGALRSRGEFVGDESETLLLTPPEGTIKPQQLLLVGLGDEETLSLERMERIGRLALRESARLGVRRAAFAPLLRDQGNSKLAAADVESAVTKGLLLAYDTEQRLQREHLAKPVELQQWIVEAGPAYFDETLTGVERGIQSAKEAAGERSNKPLRSQK